MEELMLQEEKPGFFSRIAGIFKGEEYEEEEDLTPEKVANDATQMRPNYRYTVTVRRQITSFDDALAAANGLKRGEQQILNLSATDQAERGKHYKKVQERAEKLMFYVPLYWYYNANPAVNTSRWTGVAPKEYRERLSWTTMTPVS